MIYYSYCLISEGSDVSLEQLQAKWPYRQAATKRWFPCRIFYLVHKLVEKPKPYMLNIFFFKREWFIIHVASFRRDPMWAFRQNDLLDAYALPSNYLVPFQFHSSAVRRLPRWSWQKGWATLVTQPSRGSSIPFERTLSIFARSSRSSCHSVSKCVRRIEFCILSQ